MTGDNYKLFQLGNKYIILKKDWKKLYKRMVNVILFNMKTQDDVWLLIGSIEKSLA